MERAIITGLLCTFASAIFKLDELPSELYLTATETTVLDVTGLYAGELLEFEVRPQSEFVSLQSNAQVRELASMQTAGYSLGPAFLHDSKECFARYNSSALQVWCMHSYEPCLEWEIPTTVSIQSIQPIQTEDHHLLSYLSNSPSRLFLLDLQSPTHDLIEVTGLPTASTITMCAHNLLAVLFTPRTDIKGSLLQAYLIVYPDGLAIPVEFEVSNLDPTDEVLDVACTHNAQILTSEGKDIKEDFEWELASLTSIIGIVQSFAKFDKPCIFTSKGLLIATIVQNYSIKVDLLFVPRGLLAIDLCSATPQIIVLLVVNSTLEIAGYRVDDRSASNYRYGRVQGVRPEDVTGCAVLAVAEGRAGLVLINTAAELHVVLVTTGETLLQVRGSSIPYTTEICAFEYFNTTNFLCTELNIHPITSNSSYIAMQKCKQDSATLHLDIPIGDNMTGELPISDCFYGSQLHYSLASESVEAGEMALKSDFGLKYSETEFELEQPSESYVCAEVLTGLEVVFATKGEIRTYDLYSTGETNGKLQRNIEFQGVFLQLFSSISLVTLMVNSSYTLTMRQRYTSIRLTLWL